jgi:hypothetical protein
VGGSCSVDVGARFWEGLPNYVMVEHQTA